MMQPLVNQTVWTSYRQRLAHLC